MTRPAARMSDAQYAAVNAELVRATLDSRIHRPELEATLDLHDLHITAGRALKALEDAGPMRPATSDRRRGRHPNRRARGRR